jgi:putative hydrolase of the HAD superfamily
MAAATVTEATYRRRHNDLVIDLVAFDGDDTLWHSESEFALTQARVRDILSPYCEPEQLDAHLLEVERRNLDLYGYGAKAFTLSIIETALALAGERLAAADVQAILDAGKTLLTHPVELCVGAAEAVPLAARRWPVVVVTKGDLFHQESKVARSGLGDHLAGVEIVADKTPAAYERVCRRHRARPERLVMVGNSLRSDAAPVLALGGWAVHVPYPLHWELERADDEPTLRAHERFREIDSLRRLPLALDAIDAERPDAS